MRRVALQLFVEISGVGKRLDLKPLFGQVANQQIAQSRIVIDYQNFRVDLFHRVSS